MDDPDLPAPPERQGRDWATIAGKTMGVVIMVGIVGAILAIRPVRRIVAAILVASLTWTGCEIVVGSYTERHCEAFIEAWNEQDLAIGEEVLALSTPPEGEEVEPAVHDAALLLFLDTLNPDSDHAEATARLLFECEQVTDARATLTG